MSVAPVLVVPPTIGPLPQVDSEPAIFRSPPIFVPPAIVALALTSALPPTVWRPPDCGELTVRLPFVHRSPVIRHAFEMFTVPETTMRFPSTVTFELQSTL